jgi:hypothetical protein
VVTGGNYTIEVNSDGGIGPRSLAYNDKDDIFITLKGTGAERTISLSANGSMFTVGSGVTLVLENNITLKGRNENNAPLIVVNSGGELVMNEGSSIKDNMNSEDVERILGGGVTLSRDAIFTMNGGEITNNTAVGSGGGVFIFGNTFAVLNETVKMGINGNVADQVQKGTMMGITFTVGGEPADSF